MIPQIDNSIDDTNLVNEVILPSRTYKLSSNYETQIKYGETQNAVGENLILTDSAEVKLNKLDIKGNTKQDTTTGKNLLCKEWEYGSLDGDGGNINDGSIQYIRTKDYVTVEPNTTYMLSFHNTDIEFVRANIILFNESKEADEEALAFYYNTDDNTWTFTTSSTDHYFRFTARKLGTAWDLSNIKFQIEKGSTATSYEPYTGGIASPNPEYPQDIKVISGSNVINTSNRNLMDKDREISQGSTLNSADTTRVSIRVKHKLKANTTYTVITNLNTSNFYWAFVLGTKVSPWSSTEQLYDSGWKNTNHWSYTTPQECYISIPIKNSSNTNININDVKDYWFMLYEGAYDSNVSYEPHQGKELPLDLPIENLLNISNDINTTTSGITVSLINTDTVDFNGVASNTYISTATVNLAKPLESGKTYCFKAFGNNDSNLRFRIWGYNSNNELKFNVADGNSLTLNTDIIKYKLVLEWLTVNNKYNIQAKFQVSEAPYINAYTSYGTEPIELCKIGNYQDYFYKSGSKWYLHKEIGKIIFNGSENWSSSQTNQSNKYRARIDFANITSNNYLKPSNNGEIGALLSNYYSTVPAGNAGTYGTYQGISIETVTNLHIYDENYNTNDISLFKTWLASNNVTLYYVLATATDTEITDPTLISQLEDLQKAKAYQGTTYIYTIANEISPILDVDYYPLSSIYYETAQVDRISGFIDDKDAIKQAVYHILSIERYSCLIYDDNYGVELQQYIGQDFEYLKVTIQKTLEEALMQDERIISIEVIDIEKIDNETANVKLSIQANVGEIQMEVNINV